jgi:hypothetical protein
MERFEGPESPSPYGTRLARVIRNPVGFSWLREADMGQNAGLEELLVEFRQMLPAQCETAQAIDRQEPFESNALKAIEDGYIEFSQQFTQFIETCLRRNA